MRAMRRTGGLAAISWFSLLLAACGGGSSAPADADLSLPGEACPKPTTLVDPGGAQSIGDGTPASCTEAAFDAKVGMGGGVFFFNCGPDPVTIQLSTEKTLKMNTVIDGGGLVTLDGGGTHRILSIDVDPAMDVPFLTVQRLTFQNGHGPPIDGGGGAISRKGGRLIVNQCVFKDNHGSDTGQDIAGGAIFSTGTGISIISDSVFIGNSASNGGAIGTIGSDLVLYNSRLEGNSATGMGGNPGDGGNGGALSVDGAGNKVDICGSSFIGNKANAYGGGMFRVGTAAEETKIRRSVFKDNQIPNRDPSIAGGLYLQNVAATIDDSAIVGNQARATGGLFLTHDATVAMTNTTIADNTALGSLGGGLSLDFSVTGTITSCTIAKNRAPGALAFGGGVSGEAQGVTLANSIIANNVAGNGANPINCTNPFTDGGGNLQFPLKRPSGSDDPSALCAPGVTKLDPLLGELTEVMIANGPDMTWVIAPRAGSPALGLGTSGCPMADQAGKPRPSPCTAGAVEP
jgi:hypothetical protein